MGWYATSQLLNSLFNTVKVIWKNFSLLCPFFVSLHSYYPARACTIGVKQSVLSVCLLSVCPVVRVGVWGGSVGWECVGRGVERLWRGVGEHRTSPQPPISLFTYSHSHLSTKLSALMPTHFHPVLFTRLPPTPLHSHTTPVHTILPVLILSTTPHLTS